MTTINSKVLDQRLDDPFGDLLPSYATRVADRLKK
jgi:hypothetical protein